MEAVGRIRLSLAPHMKYKYLLPNGAQYLDKASEYFCLVAKEADCSLVRVAANRREFVCESMRILFAPRVPSGKGLLPPAIRPAGMSNMLGALHTLSRMAKDAGRAETPFLRVSDARYGYWLKYNMPVSKGQVSSANAPKSPQPKEPQSAAPPKPHSDGPIAKQSEPNREQGPPITEPRAIVAPAARVEPAERVVVPADPAAVVVPPRPLPRTLSKTSRSATIVSPPRLSGVT